MFETVPNYKEKYVKYVVTSLALGVATCSAATAGLIERRGDQSPILFEGGKNYLEFSVIHVQPTVSGTALPGIPAGPTGNIQEITYLSRLAINMS